ncbi:MAG TPA: ABC transporter substrate-binding protein [Gaiellales bacterium]|jgi:iron complex transport system substrate-binding protein|nr:ABC transporter substrate-binding protein [Gaiellales bacterium]
MLPRVTALALIVLLCSSCGFKPEPTGALPAYPQTVRDALGRQVRIDTAPRRIVSLDPGMTAALYRIGAEKLLVGRSGHETYPKQALHLPVMTTGNQPDLKRIQHAQSDVVLVPQSMVPTAQDVDKLQLKAAAEVYVVGGNSVDQVENDISAMGLITDHADAGRALAAAVATSVGGVKRSVAGEPPARTYVDVGLVTPGTFTIDPASMTGDLVRLANGTNVASEVSPSQPVTFTQMAELAPDVYLSELGQGAMLSDLRKHKATRTIPAVTNKRVIQLPAAVLNEDGPRVALALARIAEALHPGATAPQ